jgi:hypothetical protein
MRKIIGAFSLITILLTAVYASPSLANSKGVPNENAVGYWTDALMKSALPLELVVDPKTKIGTLRTTSPSPTGIVDDSDWGNRGGLPQSAVGKVFFTQGRSNYVCSGSLVDDSNPDIALVITAGHCVIDKGKFVTNWMFVPNYDYWITENNRVIQSAQKWYATNLVVRSEFASQLKFNTVAVQHDWAFAVIKTGPFSKDGKSRNNTGSSLPDSGNSFTYNETGFNSIAQSTGLGYPAGAPYLGDSLKFAWGQILTDTSANTWGMPSNLTGGASGGPWLSAPTVDPTGTASGAWDSSGSVSSVNSYKYTNDSTRMYGPKFNDKTTRTMLAAIYGTCTSSSPVPQATFNLLVSGPSGTCAITRK